MAGRDGWLRALFYRHGQLSSNRTQQRKSSLDIQRAHSQLPWRPVELFDQDL